MCGNNGVCVHGKSRVTSNAVCDAIQASCDCPADLDCGHGDKTQDCGCACKNGFSNTGALPIQGATNSSALTSGVCTQCNQECSGLDKKVDSSECACVFNMLHLIWIITLVVVVVTAAGFGVWYWKQKKRDVSVLEVSTTKHLISDEVDPDADPDKDTPSNSDTFYA